MTGNIDYDRQHRLWGEAGQGLLADSRLVIVGADRLAVECAKTAAILGVGNICIIGKSKSRGEKFLDIPIDGPAVKALEQLIPLHLNTECSVAGFDAPISRTLFNLCGSADAVIDASNSPESQALCYDLCNDLHIPVLLTGVADSIQGAMSYYAPMNLQRYDESMFKVCLPGFEGLSQGTIISNILAGMLVEEYRKSLFLRHSRRFQNVRIALPGGEIRNKEGEYITYLNKFLEGTKMLQKDLEYSINGHTDRKIVPESHSETENGLEESRILLLGFGAIGNTLADIVARLGPAHIDIVDIDVFDRTNLNRQPLAYDGVGRRKAFVGAEKINKIAGKNIAVPIIGFVGEEITDEQLKKKGITREDVTLLDRKWFEKNRANYDQVFGCFDNFAARLAMTKYATEFRLKYIDGGSGGGKPNQCLASIYVPGTTNCMGCRKYIPITDDNFRVSQSVFSAQAEKRRKLVDKNRAEYAGVVSMEGTSCGAEWVDGSIYMSDKIAAGFMAGEARKIRNSSIGRPVDEIQYSADEGGEIALHARPLKCKCGEKNAG